MVFFSLYEVLFDLWISLRFEIMPMLWLHKTKFLCWNLFYFCMLFGLFICTSMIYVEQVSSSMPDVKVFFSKCWGFHTSTFAICFEQVRSLTLDVKVWEPSVINLFQSIGNNFANSIWEECFCDGEKIDDVPSTNERYNICVVKQYFFSCCTLTK